MEQKKYYVYEWYIKKTGEIFYVGKGCGNRYRVTYNRNSKFNQMLLNYECESRIVEYFENENEAFDYERKRIDDFKKNGQCKCNIHPGGAGGSGDIWTDELRKSYSDNNIMKDDKQRIRMSINNPMKNPKIAEYVNGKKRISVIIDGVQYNSLKQASEMLNITKETIVNWCMSNDPDKENYKFFDENYKHKGSKKFIPFTYLGKHYTSFLEFYDEYSIPKTTLKNWLRNGFDSNGNICRRDNDNRNLTYIPPHFSKPIIVNNIRYSSILEASKKLKISRNKISELLRGVSYDENYICTYDNQQPSQMNAKDSNLEGSTTNE